MRRVLIATASHTFGAFIDIEVNVRNIQKISNSRLEVIVSPCLPNRLDGFGIFHDSITGNDKAKIC